MGNLKNTFSDTSQAELDAAASESSMGSSSTQIGISYPVIKAECPKILKPYLPEEYKLVDNGKEYFILCDTSKYAKYFIMIRGILKACIWIGMIFYLLKELRVVISLSS